ncbi:MAG: hypothetical protein KAH77_08690 [Thiomargarita sp.]|nr:hypothetical protein [Thiomargarita sp.]
MTLVLSAIVLAYYDALNNQFIWDTQGYVVDNAHIRAFNGENLYWMFSQFYGGNWHPLTWLSHSLDYALFGLNPWGHHFVNLLIHCFNSLLVFILVIILKPTDHKTILAAGIAALLFGIHPQHVESVVWVAERKDVLCLFFILLSLLSYVFYVSKAQATYYFLTFFCFLLALLSKPMAVTFPVILLLIDIYPLKRTYAPYKLIVEKIPFFMLTVCSIVLSLLAQHQAGAMSSLETVDLSFRILNAFNSVIFYISKFFFPIHLSPFYPLQPALFHYSMLIPVLSVCLITVVCGYLWIQKKYYWLITWLFYLVTLSPVIGIIQVGNQAAADRYVYLPTIPFYILLGFGFAKIFYAEKIKRIFRLGIFMALFLISVILIQLTQKQSTIWKNELTFWTYILAYAPNNALAQNNLVVAYNDILSAYIHSNQFENANEILDSLINNYQTIKYSSLEELYYIRATLYVQQGFLVKAQDALGEVLKINPKSKKAGELLFQLTN